MNRNQILEELNKPFSDSASRDLNGAATMRQWRASKRCRAIDKQRLIEKQSQCGGIILPKPTETGTET